MMVLVTRKSEGRISFVFLSFRGQRTDVTSRTLLRHRLAFARVGHTQTRATRRIKYVRRTNLEFLLDHNFCMCGLFNPLAWLMPKQLKAALVEGCTANCRLNDCQIHFRSAVAYKRRPNKPFFAMQSKNAQTSQKNVFVDKLVRTKRTEQQDV